MRTYIVSTLTISSVFLLMVAALVQAASLFYMATVLLLLMIAARVQVAYALRGLGLRRIAPATTTVGDSVDVRFQISSNKSLRGPLLLLEEAYEDATWMGDVKPPPAFSPPPQGSVEIAYSFVPQRRGRYAPKAICLHAGDSLGIAWRQRSFTPSDEPLLVLPRPEPVPVDLHRVSGWGMAEAETGQSDGAGIDPRGVRDYGPGDSLRYIHWRTSARQRKLQVKQFETGQMAEVVLILDTRLPTLATADPALERAIRNLAFVARELTRIGTSVRLVGQGIEGRATEPGRGMRHYNAILETLACVLPTRERNVALYSMDMAANLPTHAAVYWFTADTTDLAAAVRLFRARSCDPQLYLYHRDDVEVAASGLARWGVNVVDVRDERAFVAAS